MPMCRFAATLAMLFASTVCAAQAPQAPQAPRIDRVETTDFGIYTLEPHPAAQSSLDGLEQRDVANVRLAEQTRIVPMQKGVHFGFHFAIVGTPADALVALRMVTIFPPGGLHNPARPAPIPRSEFTVTERIGATHSHYHGIALDYDWALVPGNWILEIWWGDRRLASETFTLVR
jgi:hypothetical protein